MSLVLRLGPKLRCRHPGDLNDVYFCNSVFLPGPSLSTVGPKVRETGDENGRRSSEVKGPGSVYSMRPTTRRGGSHLGAEKETRSSPSCDRRGLLAQPESSLRCARCVVTCGSGVLGSSERKGYPLGRGPWKRLKRFVGRVMRRVEILRPYREQGCSLSLSLFGSGVTSDVGRRLSELPEERLLPSE